MLDISFVQMLITSVLALFPDVSVGVRNFIASLTNQLPALVANGSDIVNFVQSQFALVRTMINENRDPTDAEWTALNDTMASELARLNAGTSSAP